MYLAVTSSVSKEISFLSFYYLNFQLYFPYHWPECSSIMFLISLFFFCCVPIMRNEWIILGYKNITLFILLGVKASVVYKIDRDRETKTDCYIDRNFFSWPYHVVSYLRPYLALLLFGRGYSTGGPLKTTALSGALTMTSSWLWLRLSLTLIDSKRQSSISIYYFLTPTTSDRCRDCFRLFLQARLWLTAWSRVNV